MWRRYLANDKKLDTCRGYIGSRLGRSVCVCTFWTTMSRISNRHNVKIMWGSIYFLRPRTSISNFGVVPRWSRHCNNTDYIVTLACILFSEFMTIHRRRDHQSQPLARAGVMETMSLSVAVSAHFFLGATCAVLVQQWIFCQTTCRGMQKRRDTESRNRQTLQ
jgi:hypothetical protein